MPKWLTNDPETAVKLGNADCAFERAKMAAANLPLAQKVEALRKARAKREAEYDAALVGNPGQA